jgi:hypothetical protein
VFLSLGQWHTLVNVRKAFGRIPDNHFSISLTALVSFAMTNSAPANRCPFRTGFGTGRSWRWHVMEIWRMLRSRHFMLAQGTFWPPAADVRVRCRAEETSCFVPIFPECYFFSPQPRGSGRLDMHIFVYSTPLWNKFILYDNLNIKGNLEHILAFVLMQVAFYYATHKRAFSSLMP